MTPEEAVTEVRRHLDRDSVREALRRDPTGVQRTKPGEEAEGVTKFLWRAVIYYAGSEDPVPSATNSEHGPVVVYETGVSTVYGIELSAWWLQGWVDHHDIDVRVAGVVDENGVAVVRELDAIAIELCNDLGVKGSREKSFSEEVL